MAEPIGPGDWVEYVGNGVRSAFTPGGLYQCSEVGPQNVPCSSCDGPCAGILLSGVPRPHEFAHLRGYLNWWPACRFRPIYRPKADLIESLKAPSPEVEDA